MRFIPGAPSLLLAALTACGEPADPVSAPPDGAGGANSSSSASSTSSSTTGGGGGPLPSADFDARCQAEGVIVCRGFDSEDELVPISLRTETGAEFVEKCPECLSIDKDIKTSGAGAMRFEIRGMTSGNHSGAFRQLMGQGFGPGTTFYAQFRLRLSTTFVDTPWDDLVGSSPKVVLFHHSSATCNDIEWAHVMNGWYDHIATMYTHCGQYGVYLDDFFQQGDYECLRGSDYANNPECLKYARDEWMTFYYKATIGDWGAPNSHLEAWYSVGGSAYQQWIDYPGFTLYAEGDSVEGFNSVYLTTYMTGKDATVDHPTAFAWYDELIVSTAPIAPPSAP